MTRFDNSTGMWLTTHNTGGTAIRDQHVRPDAHGRPVLVSELLRVAVQTVGDLRVLRLKGRLV